MSHTEPAPTDGLAGSPASAPIRVLRILARLNVGGPALVACALSRGLDSARFEQRLIAGTVTADEGDFVALRANDVPVERLSALGRDPKAGGDLRAMIQIRGAIRRFRPHIVHTHTSKAGLLGRSAAWSAGVPATVHTFHGHHLEGYFSPVKTRALVELERLLARRTTRLATEGRRVRDDLLAVGIGRPDQYVVVPPGVTLPPLPGRAAARSMLDLPGEGPVVSYVARLTGIKRPDRFIDVALAVARVHPDVTFLVAGDGELLADLRAAARPLGNRCRFLGWRPDVETIYAASDLVLLTSDNEGMPVSLIEAAMCGVPAVTTRVGSAPEVVLDGVTGIVTGVNAGELMRAVVALLSDPERSAGMGRAAAARAEHEFAEARLVADIDRLYESIARHLVDV